jgi:REP element-mobilizing transposase RayT
MQLRNALVHHPENPILFYTATILNWQHLLANDSYKKLIVDSLKFMVENNRVWIYGFVLMPNHIHLLWRMKDEIMWKDVKRDFNKFTAQIIKFDLMKTNEKLLQQFAVNVADRKYQIWERNALAIECLSKEVALQKLNYIHNNPIQPKWNLATSAEKYYFSSAKFYETGSSDFKFLTNLYEHI